VFWRRDGALAAPSSIPTASAGGENANDRLPVEILLGDAVTGAATESADGKLRFVSTRGRAPA
jgi:hypothetical protein